MLTVNRVSTFSAKLSALAIVIAGSVFAQNLDTYDKSTATFMANVESGSTCLSVKSSEPARATNVQDIDAVKAEVGAVKDAQLEEYLEMHGRVDKRSLRASMMPWSAL